MDLANPLDAFQAAGDEGADMLAVLQKAGLGDEEEASGGDGEGDDDEDASSHDKPAKAVASKQDADVLEDLRDFLCEQDGHGPERSTIEVNRLLQSLEPEAGTSGASASAGAPLLPAAVAEADTTSSSRLPLPPAAAVPSGPPSAQSRFFALMTSNGADPVAAVAAYLLPGRSNLAVGFWPGLEPTSDDCCPVCDEALDTVIKSKESAMSVNVKPRKVSHIFGCAQTAALEASGVLDKYPGMIVGCPLKGCKRNSNNKATTSFKANDFLTHVKEAVHLDDEGCYSCLLCDEDDDEAGSGRILGGFRAVTFHLASRHGIWTPPTKTFKLDSQKKLTLKHFPKPVFLLSDSAFHPDPGELELCLQELYHETFRATLPFAPDPRSSWAFLVKPDELDRIETTREDSTYVAVSTGSATAPLKHAICVLCAHDVTLPFTDP